MRKHTAIFLILLIIAAIPVVFMTACGKTELERSYARIADYRPVMLEGEGDGMRVTVISGVREDPYAADGKSSREKTDYTVITLTGPGSSEEIPASFVAGDREVEVMLSPHPFRDGYSAEIPVRLDDDTCQLDITVNGKILTASSQLPGVDGEYALTLARETLPDDGEIILRLTRNSVTGNGRYWYVSFRTESSSSSMLIDAESGEVRVVRT